MVVRYDPAGRILLLDGDEVLTEVEGGPLELDGAVGTCQADRFRLVRGQNVTADGDHATMSLGTVTVDFAPVLDALPASRFDPRAAAVRRARRAAARGDWAAGQAALQPIADLTDAEREAVLDALLSANPDRAGLRWAFALAGSSPDAVGIGRALAEAEGAAGDIAAARAVWAALPEAVRCEPEGELLWGEGDKRGARRRWASCEDLSTSAKDRCPACPG